MFYTIYTRYVLQEDRRRQQRKSSVESSGRKKYVDRWFEIERKEKGKRDIWLYEKFVEMLKKEETKTLHGVCGNRYIPCPQFLSRSSFIAVIL